MLPKFNAAKTSMLLNATNNQYYWGQLGDDVLTALCEQDPRQSSFLAVRKYTFQMGNNSLFGHWFKARTCIITAF
jgi:hypothetical protein